MCVLFHWHDLTSCQYLQDGIFRSLAVCSQALKLKISGTLRCTHLLPKTKLRPKPRTMANNLLSKSTFQETPSSHSHMSSFTNKEHSPIRSWTDLQRCSKWLISSLKTVVRCVTSANIMVSVHAGSCAHRDCSLCQSVSVHQT